MPVVSKYCDKCGIKIPVEDFEDGHALEYKGSYYCRECKGKVVPTSDRKRSEAPAEAPKAPKKAIKAPTSRKKKIGTGKVKAPVKKVKKKAAEEQPLDPKEAAKLLGMQGKPKPKPKAKARPGTRPKVAPGKKSSLSRPEKKKAPKKRPERVPVEGEEVAAAGGDSKKKFLIIGGIAAGVVLIIIVLVVALGGDGGKGPAVPVETVDVKTAQKEAIEEFKRYVADNPDDMQGFEDEVGKAKAVVTDEKLLNELESIFTTATNDAYALLCKKGQEKLDQAGEFVDEEMFDEARALIDEIPPVLKDYEFWLGVYDLEKKIEEFQDARDYVDYYLARAARLGKMGKSTEAQGTLDAVNLERLEGTPVKRLVENLIKRLKEQAWEEGFEKELLEELERGFRNLEKSIEADIARGDFGGAKELLEDNRDNYGDDENFKDRFAALEAKVQKGFEDWLLALVRDQSKAEAQIGTNLLYWNISEGDAEAFKLDEKTKGQLNGETTSGGTRAIGDTRWNDYIVKVEAKVVSGDLRIAFRVTRGAGGLNHHSYRLRGEKGEWVKYAFAALGKKFYKIDEAAGTVEEIQVKKQGEPGTTGAAGFILEDAGTVRIRNMDYIPVTSGGGG